MAVKKKKIAKVALVCTQCQRRNYDVPKSNQTFERLSLKKYCSNCLAHTLHVETK